MSRALREGPFTGRTMHEAKHAGDWFELRERGTRREWSYPGARGMAEALEWAHLEARAGVIRPILPGTALDVVRVLPESSIGAMVVEVCEPIVSEGAAPSASVPTWRAVCAAQWRARLVSEEVRA